MERQHGRYTGNPPGVVLSKHQPSSVCADVDETICLAQDTGSATDGMSTFLGKRRRLSPVALLLACAIQAWATWLLLHVRIRSSVAPHENPLLHMLLPLTAAPDHVPSRATLESARLRRESKSTRAPFDRPPAASIAPSALEAPLEPENESVTPARQAHPAPIDEPKPAPVAPPDSALRDLLHSPATQGAIRDEAHALERASQQPAGPVTATPGQPSVEQRIANQLGHAANYTEVRAADGSTFVKMPDGSCMVIPSEAEARDQGARIVRHTSPDLDARCPK